MTLHAAVALCRYDEARKAYEAAGQPHMASGILEELVECSVALRSFRDAAYYTYQRAEEELAVRNLASIALG